VHDPEKWKPVFGTDHAPTQDLASLHGAGERPYAKMVLRFGFLNDGTLAYWRLWLIGIVRRGSFPA
jgi:hypothetical protein